MSNELYRELLRDTREAEYTAKGVIEPLSFADKRITIGPVVGHLTVDYCPKKIPPQAFQILHGLVILKDNLVTPEEIIHDIYGWGPLSEQSMRPLLAGIGTHLTTIRKTLGWELGDSEYGALQTVYGEDDHRKAAGYMAVSAL